MLKKKKRKLNVKNIVLLIIFLCLIGIGMYYFMDSLNPYKENYFIEKGYDVNEVEFILSLDNTEKEKILEQDKLTNIIKHYTIDNYTEFIAIGYDDNEINQILSLDENTILFLLNHTKIENLMTWVEQDNFILTNFERYLDLAKNKPNQSIDLIIEQVNTNRDFAYYTNISKANIALNDLILVNKYYALDESFIPKDLVSIAPYGNVKLTKVASKAFIDLCEDAENEGYPIIGISGYRSYQTQANLYNRYLKKDPQKIVDTYSARPGHSEHQTGLAIDVSSNDSSILTFEMSTSFKWMKTNAHRFGFILRYQKGKEDISGFKYEPWHYRFVGIEIATILYQSGMTYDEYAALNLMN